jgi:DNA-binding NtrC family response regulator
MVEQGSLRHDFYHRLNVVTLRVPPLAERREDIPALVDHYIREFAERYQREVSGFDKDSLQHLCEAPWPGNIRELRNTIERCVILADGPILHWDSGNGSIEENNCIPVRFSNEEFVSLDELEQEYINHVLRCFKGKKTKAAKVLGIDKTTLWRKLRRYETSEEWV